MRPVPIASSSARPLSGEVGEEVDGRVDAPPGRTSRNRRTSRRPARRSSRRRRASREPNAPAYPAAMSLAQAELTSAEEAAAARALSRRRGAEFEDLVEHARAAALDRRGDRAGDVGAGARRLARDRPRRSRARCSARARRFTVLAEPNLVRASLGAHDADDGRRRAGARPAAVRGAVPAAPGARALRGAGARPRRRAAGRGCPTRRHASSAATFASPFAIGRRRRPARPLHLDAVQRARRSTRRSPPRWSTTATPSRSGARTTARDVLERPAARRDRARRASAADRSITAAVATDPARGLDDDEIVAQLRVILFGAIETVESMLLNTVLLLLEHPAELTRACAPIRQGSPRTRSRRRCG